MQTKDLLDANIQFAKKAIENGDYERAIMYLRISAVNCLELAKMTSSNERQSYYDKAKSFLDTVAVLESKTPPTNRGGDKTENNVAGSRVSGGRGDSGNAKVSSSLFDGTAKSATTNKADEIVRQAPYSRQAQSEGDVVVSAIRPKTLADYIGQPRAVLAVKDSIKSAKLRNVSLQHILVYGSHGLGKTTFARIIANEMGVNFVELNVSKLTPKELINVLSRLQDRDILFIDEIHNIPQETAESVLYSAMEDFQVCYVEMKGKEASTIKMDLPHFTLIGATTEVGKLPKPLVARSQIQCRLEQYSDEVLAQIIVSSFSKLGMTIGGMESLIIAKRCRKNPRIANRNVSRIADKAICNYAEQSGNDAHGSLSKVDDIKRLNIIVEGDLIVQFFDENGIDKLGLEEGDRTLLSILINDFGGGPTSLDTLARAMGESVNVVFEKYEDYLIKMGMIKINSAGRVATKKAYDHLDINYTKADDCDDSDDDDGGNGTSDFSKFAEKQFGNNESINSNTADQSKIVNGDSSIDQSKIVNGDSSIDQSKTTYQTDTAETKVDSGDKATNHDNK